MNFHSQNHYKAVSASLLSHNQFTPSTRALDWKVLQLGILSCGSVIRYNVIIYRQHTWWCLAIIFIVFVKIRRNIISSLCAITSVKSNMIFLFISMAFSVWFTASSLKYNALIYSIELHHSRSVVLMFASVICARVFKCLLTCKRGFTDCKYAH